MFLFVVFLEKTWLSACVWNLMFSDDVVFSYGKFVFSVCGSIRLTYVHSYSFHRSIHSNGSGQMTFAQGLFEGQFRSRFLAIVCKGGNVYGGVQFRALNSGRKKDFSEQNTGSDKLISRNLHVLLGESVGNRCRKSGNSPLGPIECHSLRVVMANAFLPI